MKKLAILILGLLALAACRRDPETPDLHLSCLKK